MEDQQSGTGTLRKSFDPWAYAGAVHPDWVIRFDDLHGIPEIMCWRKRVILLELDTDKRRRRSSLTHAIGHIELEHRGSAFDTKEERAADRYAAKMLIDLEPLGDVLAITGGRVTYDGAHALGVDVETMTARLQHLHAAERGYLHRRLTHLTEEHVA